MKKQLALVLANVLLAGCAAPAAGIKKDTAAPTVIASIVTATETPTSEVTATSAPTAKPEVTAAVEATPTPAAGIQKDKGKVGDFEVAILSAALAKTYDGKPAVVVTYEWTNGSAKAAMFLTSVMPKVFQDGVECSVTILDLKSKIDINAQMKQIKPKIKQKVYCAYALSDKTKPIQVEVGDLFSFDDTIKVVRDFSNLK